ncbi:MAG: hypothetical protein OEZ39_19910 [Gammaproteobacteria bacterium]|nr:hypothetical protein [Gammaproteobacteria bacterium]MDH5654134.1 hypothetical protein [Gammaproteobacteria bacterium]
MTIQNDDPFAEVERLNADIGEDLTVDDDFTGLLIAGVEATSSAKNQRMYIKGVCRKYVRCGSQYAAWVNFPQEVIFYLQELNGSREFVTMDLSRSFSPSPEMVERYAGLPCNQLVTQHFAVNVYQLIREFPTESGVYSIHAELRGMKSNKIIFSLAE